MCRATGCSADATDPSGYCAGCLAAYEALRGRESARRQELAIAIFSQLRPLPGIAASWRWQVARAAAAHAQHDDFLPAAEPVHVVWILRGLADLLLDTAERPEGRG